MEKELQLYCSRQTFDVARVWGAIMIFCCHASLFYHNYFGYFPVAIFFFISGYGMEFTGSRLRALLRMPRFIAVFGFYSIIYYLVYNDWYFPTAWFLLMYSLNMLVYRFWGSRSLLYLWFFAVFMYVFCLLDFSYYYWTLPFAFLMGVFVCRYRYFWSWSLALVLACLSAFYFVFWNPLFLVLFFPLFLRLVFWFSSLSIFRPLACFAPLVFPFFSLHCWFLGLFGATWTLGGSYSYFYSLLSFVLSFVGAWLLWRFVPLFSKKKFWIFQ